MNSILKERPFQPRLDKHLAGLLKEVAKQENRTASNMAIVLIKEALAQRGIQTN